MLRHMRQCSSHTQCQSRLVGLPSVFVRTSFICDRTPEYPNRELFIAITFARANAHYRAIFDVLLSFVLIPLVWICDALRAWEYTSLILFSRLCFVVSTSPVHHDRWKNIGVDGLGCMNAAQSNSMRCTPDLGKKNLSRNSSFCFSNSKNDQHI